MPHFARKSISRNMKRRFENDQEVTDWSPLGCAIGNVRDTAEGTNCRNRFATMPANAVFAGFSSHRGIPCLVPISPFVALFGGQGR